MKLNVTCLCKRLKSETTWTIWVNHSISIHQYEWIMKKLQDDSSVEKKTHFQQGKTKNKKGHKQKKCHTCSIAARLQPRFNVATPKVLKIDHLHYLAHHLPLGRGQKTLPSDQDQIIHKGTLPEEMLCHDLRFAATNAWHDMNHEIPYHAPPQGGSSSSLCMYPLQVKT